MRDLDRQLEFIVDAEAEPVDQDQALARFLLSFVRTETSLAVADQEPNVPTTTTEEKT